MLNKNSHNLRDELITNISDLNEEQVLRIVKNRLSEGDDPISITQDCQEGLRHVGLRYERQEYYLAGLIMAGEIFRQVMDILQPSIKKQLSGKETGSILIGTAKGDIHDIGKSNIIMLLSSYGFTVYDLGVDVPPSVFLLKAAAIKPDIIGISGLMTSSNDSMKETINLIRTSDEAEINSVPVIIGGNQLNEQVAEYIGADYWVTDAMLGVRICQKLTSQN